MKHDGRTEKLKHQGADIRFSGVIAAAIVFAVTLALIQAGIWIVYRYLRTTELQRDVRRTFVETKPPVPPEPRLQVNPQADLQEYLRQQRETLTSYGWIS